MQKTASLWTVSELMTTMNRIHFPEYQREPTIWTRAAKQRLIDSIARQFDISAIYLYHHEEGHWDCVDGRQRIAAIGSFLGKNSDDSRDNRFAYRVMNEVFDDTDHPYGSLDGLTYDEINTRAGAGEDPALSFKTRIADYEITVVELSQSVDAEEFNLQFTRLNLGQLIISGEKLNAMVGALRDLCFHELGQHEFLSEINIPTRRYAREQLAAQIVAQVFAVETCRRDRRQREFARVRHLDLQRLFKEHATLGADEARWINQLRQVMDHLAGQREWLPELRSRSIVLSLVLLAYELGVDDAPSARQIADFSTAFVGCLREQVALGLDANPEYRYLIDFQRRLTQASGEKYSVADRARELEKSFGHWRETGRLRVDGE